MTALPRLHRGSPNPWTGQDARDTQANDPASHLSLYRKALALRRECQLGTGSLQWAEEYCSEGSLAFLNGNTLVLITPVTNPCHCPQEPSSRGPP